MKKDNAVFVHPAFPRLREASLCWSHNVRVTDYAPSVTVPGKSAFILTQVRIKKICKKKKKSQKINEIKPHGCRIRGYLCIFRQNTRRLDSPDFNSTLKDLIRGGGACVDLYLLL